MSRSHSSAACRWQRSTDQVATEVRKRFAEVMELKARADGDLDANRAYVVAMLDLQVWSHRMYQAASAPAHLHART